MIGAEEASGSNPAAAQPCQVNETVISDGTRYGRFTAWRVPGAIASHEAPADPALPANFWRHEVSGFSLTLRHARTRIHIHIPKSRHGVKLP